MALSLTPRLTDDRAATTDRARSIRSE